VSGEPIIEADPRTRKPGKRGRQRPVTVNVRNGRHVRRPIGYKRRVKDVADQVMIHERRAAAYKLRSTGHTLLDIGKFLHADPSVNTDKSLKNPDGSKAGVVGGYGWQNYVNDKPPLLGPALTSAVSHDMLRGLEVAAADEDWSREQYRRVELATLNAAQAAQWPRMQTGDPKAVEAVVKVSERRSKLLGLDAPVQIEQTSDVTVHHEGVQPVYDRGFAEGMFSALQQLGVIDEVPELTMPALSGPDAPVDAEVVEPAAGG
jgi:hypothetical protein